MAKVRSFPLRGKTINVPHTEDVDGSEKGTVTFDTETGEAEVSDTLAEALLRELPFDVEPA